MTDEQNDWWLGEVPPCTKCSNLLQRLIGGILPNHCYKPFLLAFGLTLKLNKGYCSI